MLRTLPVAAQGGGVLAVLAGLFMLLPLGWFLVAAGGLVVVLGTVAEVVQGRPSGRSDRRSGARAEGAA